VANTDDTTAEHTSALNGVVKWLGSLPVSYVLSQCRRLP